MRKRFVRSIGAGVLALVWMASPSQAAEQPSCDAAKVASAKEALAADCPCANKADGNPWKNHGQYVSCVARARRTEADAAAVSRRCLKDVVFCAANSTCGKPNVVTCSKPIGTCVDDPTPGDGTKDGTCDIDSSAACDTNADCVVTTCAVTSTDQCTEAGGAAGSGSCCPD